MRGNGAGFDADKERAREGVKGGTARDDERHVARKPRMDAGDDARGARRGKTEKGEGRRLTGGARRGIFIFFSFFFQGCDMADLKTRGLR